MDGGPVAVALVDSRIEAELIVGLLRSHGVNAAFAADDVGGQEPQLNISQGVRVLVPPADQDLARRLIAGPQTDADSDADSQDAD